MWKCTQTPRLIIAALLLAAATMPIRAQFRYTLLPQETIQARLRDYTGKDADREMRLKKMFVDSGCQAEQLSEQIVKSKYPPNVICLLPGKTDEQIVVGAHFDHAEVGDGVVDNWSGASLLPSLFYSVRQEPRRYTYVFIGFMGEELKMMGSEYCSGHLTKEQRSRVRAMINLDSMGLGPTEVWVSHSDPVGPGAGFCCAGSAASITRRERRPGRDHGFRVIRALQNSEDHDPYAHTGHTADPSHIQGPSGQDSNARLLRVVSPHGRLSNRIRHIP